MSRHFPSNIEILDIRDKGRVVGGGWEGGAFFWQRGVSGGGDISPVTFRKAFFLN